MVKVARFLVLGIVFTFVISCECFSQKLNKSYYPRLSIEAKDTVEVAVDSLYIDTLILADHSVLRFTMKNTILIAENSYIGTNCIFLGSGQSGGDAKPVNFLQGELNGEDGKNGLNLKIFIVIKALGSFTVQTTGGDGGNGAKGRRGEDGQNATIGGNDGVRGGNGGNGGNGGSGGNFQFYYTCDGFNPVFNSSRGSKNAITLNLAGGNPGSGGIGGVGGRGGQPIYHKSPDPNGGLATSATGVYGRDGSAGFPGVSGKVGSDGELILKRIPD